MRASAQGISLESNSPYNMARRGRNLRRRPAPRPRRRAQVATRSNAARILASGVGASVPRAFGDVGGRSLACWDAKNPQHLPLPRAVGPYTTIRATRRVSTGTRVNLIGTFQGNGEWNRWLYISDANATQPINATNNTVVTSIDLSGLGDAATLVPSALSVQIMCPAPLQNASGIIYAGVMNTQAAISGRTESWDSWADKFVQFQNPRLLAASKLALRGVQINSYPLNMSEVSNFTPLKQFTDGVTTYDPAVVAGLPEPKGWAPIVIYNTGNTPLEFLITVEYRVRFDLDHPASASHTHHPVAPDSTWDRLMRHASALGNGVIDIADVVANTGMAVGRAAAVGNRLAMMARTMPAIAA